MNQTNITLTLPVNQVQFIVNALDQMPHGQVRAILDAIVQQAQAQTQPADTGAPQA